MAPTTTAASNTAAALSVLAGCNLKELHLKRADGSRMLDTLHSTCRSAGLIPAGTPEATPKERYLAVFDAALQGGLGAWILDYVEVVCADRHLTSNDPLEAYLLDGGFVKAWAQTVLQRAEQAAESTLRIDGAFQGFQAGPLQLQLAQMRILVSILRALDRIRTVAAGGSMLGAVDTARSTSAGSGAVQDRLSVKAELKQALLLEQAFQVMDWCARQGLIDPRVHSTGRFLSYPEWSRALNARRSRAVPRPLFLDSLLQSLRLSGAYPFNTVTNMLHTLLLVVRDVDPATWSYKLALLSYYLLDAGVLESNSAGDPASAAASGGSGSAVPGSSGSGSGVEAALEDLRRTFRLSPGEVGLWQCHYLLDCGAPDSPGASDPHLARACALLPSCVTPDTPFAFIEALLVLGRPDVALAVDRGQSGSGTASAARTAAGGGDGGAAAGAPRACRTLAQAMTLLDVRLRCGLMTEGFTLLRTHTADLAARGEAPEGVREHTRALLRRLASWALESDSAAAAQAAAAQAAAGEEGAGGAGGGDGWLNRLTQMPLNATEEVVLVEWLAEEADAGRPAGAFLPLLYLQRGRVLEATAAMGRWSTRRDALAAAGHVPSGTPPATTDLIAAAVDAAYRALVPLNLRGVAVAPRAGLPADIAGMVAEASRRAPGQGAVGILEGFSVNDLPDQPVAVLHFHGSEPPPLLTSPVPLPPGPVAPPPPPPAPAAQAALVPAAGPSVAGAPAAGQPFVAMPLQLPSAAPFRAPPGTPGMVLGGAMAAGLGSTFGVGGGGGGGGGLLFSVGAGGVGGGGSSGGAPPGGVGAAFGGAAGAAGLYGGGAVGAPPAAAVPRSSKRPKPNTWL